MQVYWEKSDQGLDIFWNHKKIGTAIAYPDAEDHFIITESGVICWRRKTALAVSEMTMRFATELPLQFSLIPAVQYDGNQHKVQDFIDVRNSAKQQEEEEKKEFLTFFQGQREPSSALPWRFAWHRASVAGGLYTEGDGFSVAGFLPPEQLNAASSLYEENGSTVLEWLWPEQEGPHSVYTEGAWHENFAKPMSPQQEFAIMLVFTPIEQPRQAWNRMLEVAWEQFYTLQAAERSHEQLWELGISFAKQLYTEEADGFKGFSIGFTWEHNSWIKRPVQKYEIGWCGQNASLANSLLVHAQLTCERDAADMAIAVLDAWLAAAKPTGLIPTHYDDNMYTNGHAKTVDACNLGTAAVQLFAAEQYAAALGIKREAYGEMARRICDFALTVIDESGRIGKSWLEANLTPAVLEGGTGAFLTTALCEGARRTGSEQYLEAAKRSHAYYMGQLQQQGFTTGGALDLLSIDKESCIPLLQSSMLLYKLSGEQYYLQCAEHAAWYLSTWQWHYSKPFPADSLLGQLRYNTFGGTAVSIHGGIDPFALCYVNELHDLAQATGKEQWKQRAAAIWRHGQQGISEGDLVLDGRSARPRGSQDESCNYTYGAGENRATQWLVAWPAAFRLEAMRNIISADAPYKERIL